jgi:hypothetical protein
VTRVMLVTAATDREAVVEQLFGSRSIRVEKSLHAGFGQFARNFDCFSGRSSAAVISLHSMLALFKPFTDPDRYSRACEIACGSLVNGMNVMVGLRRDHMFRSHPAVCLDCVREDLQRRYFAYYRRSHQVLAASYCAIHKTPLILACSSCGTLFSHSDLPSLECHRCGEQLTQMKDALESMPDRSARIRLSKVLAAVFAGEIAADDVNLRLAILRNQTKHVVHTRSGVIGDNLATHINRVFGREFLASLSLHTQSAPTLGWPALMIHGRFLVNDPIANSLLIAALFDSVDHYNTSIKAYKASPEILTKKPKQLDSPGNISFSMLREILGATSLNTIVQKNNRKNRPLLKWVAAYPGLSKRRAAFLFRKKLNRYKKSIRTKLQAEPELTRTQLATALKSAFSFVQRHDPQWLCQNLPVQMVPCGAKGTAGQKLRKVEKYLFLELMSSGFEHI